MPLSRHYKSDLIYNTPRLKGQWYTDTIVSNIESIEGSTCAQIFANDNHFVPNGVQSNGRRCITTNGAGLWDNGKSNYGWIQRADGEGFPVHADDEEE